MAFAAECVQFTLVRDLAFEIPETFERLENSGALTRWEMAFMVTVTTFAVGWLAVAVVTLRTGVLALCEQLYRGRQGGEIDRPKILDPFVAERFDLVLS